jgi:hypothetical protein
MDSAVLGLASPVMVDVEGTVLTFEQKFSLEDVLLDPTHDRLKRTCV